MSKLAKAFVVVALLWLVIVGAGYFALGQVLQFVPRVIQVTEKAERTETLTHPAADISTVNITSKNGSVTVVAGEGTDIVIKAFYAAHGSTLSNADERLKGIGTELTAASDTLNIVAVYPSTVINNQSIRYEVAIPRGIDVKVKTSNGRINVEDLEGKVDLHSTNGSIDVVSQRGPQELLVYTSNGRINVTAAPTQGKYNLRTTNGGVTVALPEATGVNLKASTSNGTIDLGYGQWVFAGGQISSRDVSAQLGDGAVTLDIQTSNGTVKLQKR